MKKAAIAAIAGAAVGAQEGKDALPVCWRQGLLGRAREHDDGRVFALFDQEKTLFNTAR